MQPIAAVLARGDIDPHPEPLDIEPYRYQMLMNGNSAVMTEEGPEGRREYPVLYTLGGKNIYYFLTMLDRGRLQVMPLAFEVRSRRWIDTTGSMVRHAEGIEDEALYWKERPLTFNTSCFDCHVSQLSRNYDIATDTYRTTWTEPGINCEVCHGPGSEHVRVFREARDKGEPTPTELYLIRMADLTPQQINDSCARCHAKMRPLTQEFIPGERFYDHFDLVTFEHSDYYPDGRDLGENFTMTSWAMNVCNRNGQLDCLHCHTSSGRYRFQGETANHACLPCHQERVENATEHTRHAAGSKANECVSCHMPMTVFAQIQRSDHSFRPPAPAATIEFGSPNACNLCHKDQTPEWADVTVRSWRSRDYQKPILEVGRLIKAAREEDWSKLDRMLAYLEREDREEVVSASLLRLLANCPDGRIWPAARRRMEADPSPLVRAAAAELLGWRRDIPANRAALLAGCRDDYRLVRIRSAVSLSGARMDDVAAADREAFEAAITEYRESLNCRPDDWSSHYNIGNLYLDSARFDDAVGAFQMAARLAPEQVMPWVNGAMAHARAGNLPASVDWLRNALHRDPTNAVASFNLGLAIAEQGDLRQAESLLRTAVASDPRLAEAAFNLGVIVGARDPVEGAEWTGRAAALRPQDERYGYTHAYYLVRAGKTGEARAALERITGLNPANAEAVMMLGEILERDGRSAEARALYQRAIEHPRLPSDAASRLRRRLRALPP